MKERLLLTAEGQNQGAGFLVLQLVFRECYSFEDRGSLTLTGLDCIDQTGLKLVETLLLLAPGCYGEGPCSPAIREVKIETRGEDWSMEKRMGL